MTQAQIDARDMAAFQIYATLDEARRNAIVSQSQFINDFVRTRNAEVAKRHGQAKTVTGGFPQDNNDGYEGDFDPVGSDGSNPDVYSDGY